jgi:hypothetical protein
MFFFFRQNLQRIGPREKEGEDESMPPPLVIFGAFIVSHG